MSVNPMKLLPGFFLCTLIYPFLSAQIHLLFNYPEKTENNYFISKKAGSKTEQVTGFCRLTITTYKQFSRYGFVASGCSWYKFVNFI